MGRFFISFFAVLILLIACAWFWVVNRPLSFLAADYPVWKLKREMAADLPPNSVALLGDSRALADIMPARIAPDVFNLALGGGTSIDSFALARILVDSPHPPRAVILSLSPIHCIYSDSFWNHSVKYGLLDGKTLAEVRARARLSDQHSFDADLFGPETAGDAEARFKVDLFSIRFPSFYFSSLIAGGVFLREAHNRDIYREVRKAGGFFSYGVQKGSRELCAETSIGPFVPSRLFDSYFSDTVALFQSRNIPVYFIVTPMNEVSAQALPAGFAAHYVAYIKSYETKFPNFHRLGDPFPIMPWTAYGDANHLNPDGAAVFSDRIASLLREAAIEK